MSKLLEGLAPLPRATLSEQVAKQLAARIVAGDWKAGEKLPSEAELCKAFHVGRSSLREALTSLAFIGLIRVRAGGGSYVAEQPSTYYTSAWLSTGTLNNEKALQDFMEARMILECEIISLCAERITDEELRELDELVSRMHELAGNPDEYWKLDLAFHLALGTAAKNEVLTNILKDVREQMRDLISKSLLLREGIELALVQHARMVEALRQHNPVKARAEMLSHLQNFQRGYRVLMEEAARQ
ncbi:MAG: FadR/GntR family transcriptional regulator [Acidobacteriota bacterium]|nr:FadR/GntR family transcriptional regulator [Acidobacteriota bacterium]